MAYFTTYFQKKALRFALSQLGLFDEHTFDLESPGISWGTTTTIELRDVPLSVSRLTELLQLPNHVELSESRISLLRLTLPLNFVSNSVKVEIEGVRVKLLISPSDTQGVEGVRPGAKSERTKAGNSSHNKTTSDADGALAGLPTADDLAGSFLATQSVYEKTELQSAIAGLKKPREQIDSEDGEAVGLGPDISLKTFFSNLARGVLDRFKAILKDIQLEATFKLPITNANEIEYSQASEEVTFCLDIENVDIPPVSQAVHSADPAASGQEIPFWSRNVSIIGIHGSILSTSALSSFMTQLSRSPSPALSRATSKLSATTSSPEASSRGAGLRSALRQDTAAAVDSSSQSERSFESFQQRRTTSRIQSQDLWHNLGPELSIGHYGEDRPPAAFGEDSQALGDSEQYNAHDEFHSLTRLGSDLENSALSESSESFLGKSPTEQHHNSSSLARTRSAGNEDSIKPSPPGHGTSDNQRGNVSEEDLTESRFFSAEEAKSIYMSAMSSGNRRSSNSAKTYETRAETSSPDSPFDVFHDASTGTLEQPPTSHTEQGFSSHGSASLATGTEIHEDPFAQESSDDDSPPASLLIASQLSEPETEFKASLPAQDEQVDPTNKRLSMHQSVHNYDPQDQPRNITVASPTTVKTLFIVDGVHIQLPPSAPALTPLEDYVDDQPASTDLPGAFSYHNSMSASTATTGGERPELSQELSGTETEQTEAKIAVNITNVVVCFDMALLRLLVTMLTFIPATSSASPRVGGENKASYNSSLSYQLHVQRLIVRFEQALKSHPRHSSLAMLEFVENAFLDSSDDLLRCFVQEISITARKGLLGSHLEATVSKFSIGFPGENIMSFNRNLKLRESVRDFMTPTGYDIVVKLTQNQANVNQIEINTAPLHVKINVNRLAEVVNWLGGLSTVIDLGNSVKSNMTITGSPPRTVGERARGVRFDIVEPTTNTKSQIRPASKCNLRFGGLAIDVIGREAGILVEGSALKVVFRDGAVRAQIDRLNLYGPLLHGTDVDPSFVLTVDSLAVSYFDLPKENDLTRLLALLSPSQEREDQDDDVLLDTLLRQRRKGSVLRISVTKTKAKVSQLQNLRYFNTLAEEFSQLSSVTKYLPEDDRPGLLILLAIDSLQTTLDISQNMQSVLTSLQNLQLALVTFPSLFLMAIDDVNATQAGLELIGRATPDLRKSTTRQTPVLDEPPQLSIKFIAGEMEPTVRLRLNGLRFEYHVSTVMAFLNISETSSGDVIVAEMVNTVANLAAVDNALGQSLLFQPEDLATKKEKPFRIAVVVRDTTVGLNPKGKPGHGLLVLTKCRLTATHAEEHSPGSHASFDLAKASLMVIDDKTTLLTADKVTNPNVISGLGTKPSQIQCLEAIGYVSVGEISAAKVTAQLKEADANSLLDVQIRNDLLVLETCADSTQTLLSIMGGLSPPMPPRKGNRYRTEVVPIENMLASFTGDAFPTEMNIEDDTDYAMSSDDETGTVAFDDEDSFTARPDTGSNRSYAEELSDDSNAAALDFGSVIFRQPKSSETADPTFSLNFQEAAETAASLHFDENHFGKVAGGGAKEWNTYKNSYDAANPAKIHKSPLQIHFDDIHFIWNLYDGYDWQKTRETISQAVEDIEIKAEERRAARRDKLRNLEDEDTEAVIGDMLFNSIYIGISVKDDPRELSRRVNGILNDDSSDTGSYATSTTISTDHTRQGPPRLKRKRLRLGRSKHHKMTFEVKGISGNVVCFPPDSGETQSSIDVKIRDFEIFDNLPTSTWKKFATYLHDAGSRQLGSSMVHIEMLVVKPDHELLASEFVLKVGVLPLRLHVDQDALDFLTRFFEFRDDDTSATVPAGEPPFIQRAEVGPVQIKLDFKPKRVDWKALRSGKTSEFMNFIILDEADMILRRIILYGVRGFDKLGRSLNDIWTPDVRTNQLPGVLAGLAPVRPLVNVGLGMRDLVVVPMREYKKDGRLVRAIRKGVVSFGKTTTTELAKLGAKIAIGTHTMLSGAEELLAPDVSRSGTRDDEQNLTATEEQPILSPYADQPVGVVQGLRGAYRGLERDLLLAKDAIIAMPGEVMDSSDTSGAAAAILRTAPVVILRPAMGITKAVGQTLLGATNSLDKTERRKNEDKYKHR